MHFTRAKDLFTAAVIGLAAGYVLFQAAYAKLPGLPVLAGITLLMVAVIDLGLAFWVRGLIGEARVTKPIVVARSVALAKASSLLGALMGGAWLGVLLYLAPRLSTEAPRQDVPAAVVGTACAALLVAAGLWLEHCCRTPDRDDEEPSDERRR